MKRLLLVVAACGGSSAPKPTTPPEPKQPVTAPRQAQQPAPAIAPEVFCQHFVALRDGGCAAFASIQMTRDECIKELSAASDDPAEAEFMAKTGQCVVTEDTCDAVIACLASLGPKMDDLRACNEEAPGKAVGIPQAE